MHSRKIIGQATGILMERYDMNEDRAFAFLVRASSHGNIKLRAVAQELVDEYNRRWPQGGKILTAHAAASERPSHHKVSGSRRV